MHSKDQNTLYTTLQKGYIICTPDMELQEGVEGGGGGVKEQSSCVLFYLGKA
jgi:hypothetical protein